MAKIRSPTTEVTTRKGLAALQGHGRFSLVFNHQVQSYFLHGNNKSQQSQQYRVPTTCADTASSDSGFPYRAYFCSAMTHTRAMAYTQAVIHPYTCSEQAHGQRIGTERGKKNRWRIYLDLEDCYAAGLQYTVRSRQTYIQQGGGPIFFSHVPPVSAATNLFPYRGPLRKYVLWLQAQDLRG